MNHIETLDRSTKEIDNQTALINECAPISTPVPEISSDWMREADGSGGQSFYWCESPLDVSLGGSDDY